MIYRDRKYLSILTLTEDRDYVTYDELIHVLDERPSGRVYIERDGILCGLITAGRIERRHDEKTRRVPFNKKFTCIHSGEYSHAWKILEKINEVPVISEDGCLLGDYVRWNDSIGTNYAELLLKDPYVLQGLKEDIQNTVFVEPGCPCGGGKSSKMSLWWKQKLDSEGIHFPVIQPWEIKDYINGVEKFLFIDGDEKIGIEVLYQYLYYNKEAVNRAFYTITGYLYRTRRIADLSFLKEIQKQGVSILVFDFIENSGRFLEILNKKIRKRNDDYGINPANCFPEELKKSFLDELYRGPYKTKNFPPPRSYHTQWGIPYLSDVDTELYHVRNGERLTVNQPKKFDRCMYLYGPCIVEGVYVSDDYTIGSLLQSEINQAGFSCKVINRGFPLSGDPLTAERMLSGTYKQGDIIVLDQLSSPVRNFPILNLTDVLEKYDAPADWFWNKVRHCNHKANQVFAHAIYEELIPILQLPPKGRNLIELDHDYIDRGYLRHYFSDFDPTNYGTVGSIVINCNPFTLGHRFLIEEALKTVDFLIIFVVEEDASLFFFQERFAMVCQGTSDLERVTVVPSGPYILSKNTFPEYFQKIDDEDLKKNTEDDITLFAEKIAPRLGITYRFVGEEREDKVTNEYNEAMKRILPRYGIQVIEIPRKANGQSAISASRVRQCLSMNQMEELDELIPASTKRILFYDVK